MCNQLFVALKYISSNEIPFKLSEFQLIESEFINDGLMKQDVAG